jgi:hypothetical protein
VLDVARPFFQEVGEALGGGEVVLVPGNHDHQLLLPWLERRRAEGVSEPLGLEEPIPADAGEATAQLARWLEPARLSLAYPGTWLRPDVYATHGHYVDCHLTIPTFERLAAALMARLVGDPRRPGATPDAYEAALTPIYSWIHNLAQPSRGGEAAAGIPELSAGVWRRLAGRERGLAGRVGATAAVPVAVALANRLGLGPFRADLSTPELRRAGLAAMRGVVDGLGIRAEHVVFGHTHRTGPLPGDDAGEWVTSGGTRLLNSGNWIYSRHFLTPTPGESPYWPGGCVVVEDDGPPRLRRLLQETGHSELTRPRGAAA